MRTSAKQRRPARAGQAHPERKVAVLEEAAQHQEQLAQRLAELQAQITAHQLALALTIKILAARDDEDGEAVEVALYVAAEERAEEHGENDELAKAIRALHDLVREALTTN
jgi:hypothetical protein